MNFLLPAQDPVTIRLLQATDADRLFDYFSGLSAISQSRFGPHSFDRKTIDDICTHLPGDTFRYIATDAANTVIAYMLIKQGWVDGDWHRYLTRNIYYDLSSVCTFAPSVTDGWQNAGLGSHMYDCIEDEIRQQTSYRHIVLWGGVQAANSRAVHFYEKKGFQHVGSFWNKEKNNFDMIKCLKD